MRLRLKLRQGELAPPGSGAEGIAIDPMGENLIMTREQVKLLRREKRIKEGGGIDLGYRYQQLRLQQFPDYHALGYPRQIRRRNRSLRRLRDVPIKAG